VLAQIVAEDLGLPLEAVRAVSGNTSQALLDAGTGGSKATYSISRAALEASRALNEQLGPVAASLLECAVDDLERAEQAYRVKGQPSPTVPVAQVVAEAARQAGGSLETSAPGPGRGREVTQPCFVASVVEVAVDRETGRVTPLKITTALDVGTAINPLLLQGQVDGATVQGLGMAVMEHLVSEQGHSSTLNLGEYKIPCMADLPPLKSAYVEGAPGPAPYQAKAVGELANCAVPAALASAVAQAVGARVTSLPITAEKVWAALRRPEAPR
jgi:CO/xanthine dehydrogenase Mo-binding subunit